MVNEPQFEQGITPETERANLRERVLSSPEQGREIIKEYAELPPEKVYAPEYNLSPEEMEKLERRVIDVNFEEKEKVLQELFNIAREKGIINAAKAASKLPPSLLDDFHDLLVRFVHEEQNQAQDAGASPSQAA
ncbi:MAG: hypothetical protein PHC85_00285 [Candidatus Pacebacteria bacterium]|nr:hypothetical protein [Candidatus Paceibacterota bacterium]